MCIILENLMPIIQLSAQPKLIMYALTLSTVYGLLGI